MTQLRKNRVLGIDPGTQILGYGIIEYGPNIYKVLDCSVIKLNKLEDDQTKLREIFLQIQDIIEANQTGILSIELPFYGKNPQSMLKLGRAQGVAIAAAIVMGVEIHEFSAKKIKKAVTGNGNASKEQVCDMISRLLNYQIDSKYYDASDALAAAYCYTCQNQNGLSDQNGPTSWKSFISSHPDRIHK
ncbi:MAG: crossover junction endodeoxyribonuclease RuvC [Saprospiraceae bacterium]|nr:crossover junction endodeoxyribonuclease RuvC [Saprospiraceae bacterium]MBK7810205.1 crossover junction endodeoxyribonuclease RuvC [Saprospiraceae bacterium]MBK9629809.1 crossover junction endodeoxyribonuclease RuvC [Saprospiraceae bacterium]